jgi:transcriptional regulator GlxA family with amidase domain
MDAAEATWEPLDDFRSAHPSFQLEDELFVEGGEDVMVRKVYTRRKKRAV